MKRFLKVLGVILAVLVFGVLAYVYIGYNTWSPGTVEYPAEKTALNYFRESYTDCRSEFIQNATLLKKQFDSTEIFSVPVPGSADNDLTIDFCYVPAGKEKSKLLILSSGIHGIEGFVGSAIQNMVMKELTDSLVTANIGLLFIHAMNPYGFKNFRRVTENNVDLNRNFDSNNALFGSVNQGYTNLYDLLNPSGKVNSGSLKNKFFMLLAIQKMLKASMKALRQAVLQGQYQYPEGLYFGGKGFEPQVSSVSPVLVKYASGYNTVMNIDLHTGYGALGNMHLFPNPVTDPKVKSAMEQVFNGYTIDWGDSKDFYTINGAFSDYIGDLMNGKLYVPMTFEFGTLNSQTTSGSIHSIHNMILENQGFHYGFQNNSDREVVLKNFREMYYPSSEAWRSKVIGDSKKMISQVFSRFSVL